MTDDELRAYVEAIEEQLGRLRGAEHTLSPRDFALVRAWQASGVSLAVVLVALDETFEGRGDGACVAACRHRIDRMASPGRSRESSRESSSVPDVVGTLDALVEGIERLPSKRGGVLGLALERARELRAFLSVASRPNFDYLDRRLGELEAEIDRSVLAALDPETRCELGAAAQRAVERHRGRVLPEALAEAANRSLVQRARERLGLPRSLGV